MIDHQPTTTELGNLLASLHIGQGLRRNLHQDSLELERVSHFATIRHERATGQAAAPRLAEEVLAAAKQVGPLVDTRAAYRTAMHLFNTCVTASASIDSLRMLTICHSFLISALHRVVRDQHAGIPIPACRPASSPRASP